MAKWLWAVGAAAVWVVAVASGGCTFVNRQLNTPQVAVESRAHNHTRAATGVSAAPVTSTSTVRVRAENPTTRQPLSLDPASYDVHPDGCFVGLALSGGGSRSANFSAACMFQLQRIGLLQHVDYISSVSGGSLTGAYYCLTGDGPGGWNPASVQKKLTHSFASDVIVQTLLPWNWPGLWFTDLDRSDVLSDSFTKTLFSRKGRTLTFADLRPDRPRLLINATDLQSGRRFVFSNEMFDEINSDLAKYPISKAVAASSAVPVVMHHVTLRDFSTTFKQYRHLIDGGVVDNLGVTTLIEAYAAQVKAADEAGRPDPYPRGAVIIVLDAHTEFDAKLSSRGDISFIESLFTGAELTSTALLNRVSSATLADLIVRNASDDTNARTLREEIAKLERGGSLTVKARGGKPVRVLHVALSRVNDLSSLPSHSFREQVNSISTYFNIDATEAYNLYQAAELLVRERFEGELVQIKDELEGRGSATTLPAAETQPSPAR